MRISDWSSDVGSSDLNPMANKLKMKAPEGPSGEASIEGHSYEIPKSGVITVISETHVETLKRHGFTQHFDEPKAVSTQTEELDENGRAPCRDSIEQSG